SRQSTSIRVFDSPNLLLPKIHLLSNGNYSIMLTDKGTGYSQTKMMAITRWREDISLDSYGMFFYIRNVNTNDCWSATYAPLMNTPKDYRVVFTSDKVLYKRVDGFIETQTEVVITSGEPLEIRRLTFRNTGKETCLLEITSYYEVVLTTFSDDVAHPCFSNLFVKTEARPDLHCILANRRPRAETDKSAWLAHSVVTSKSNMGDVQYETDRMKMIGRGHTVQNPVSIEKGHFLSNSVGAVLDPVMSLRTMVELEPSKEMTLSFVSVVGASRESVLSKIQRYASADEIESAFQLALTRSHVETNYLNLDANEVELYQNMLSHIVMMSPSRKKYAEKIMCNEKGQSALWRYGISGDHPIVLVCLRKDEPMHILYDILQAHEYWHLMDLKVDLVLLVDEEISYHLPLKRLVSDIVSSRQTIGATKERKDIFILDTHSVLPEDIPLLYAVARMVLKSDVRSLDEQMLEPSPLPSMKMVPYTTKSEFPSMDFDTSSLQCFNGLGGFSESGMEYKIILRHEYCTPAPWINVIANQTFGFIVSDLGSGYTWYGNSRENKLTPWSNDTVSDPPGEIIYIRDDDTGVFWSITPLPIRQKTPYRVTHGFGYSVFEHSSCGVRHTCTQFVPMNEPVKISLISLHNDSSETKTFTITNYIRPVLGVTDQSTALHIRTSYGSPCNLLIENPYNEDYPHHVAFLTSSLNNLSMTGDRQEFFGAGSMEQPECLLHKELSGALGVGFDPCASVQGSIQLEPNETKEFVFVFGMGSSQKEATRLAQKYRRIKKSKNSLEEVQEFWNDATHTVHVQTPDETMDLMINGWLPYQVISCRLWARSAFYQSGGAYGFRDQLQDCISIAHIAPSLSRSQILLHAQHQFIEGDVQHWWHEPSGKGTRTRITDDRLWLPYATAEHIRITGDMEILQEVIPYLESPPLQDDEEERYEKPNCSKESSSLFEHCIRAIEISLQFGSHGLPLMGTGDWNDGMNTVGNKGKGESVWLGWFLYSVLDLFVPLCQKMGDERKARKYVRWMDSIQKAIEKHAWDGYWYRRAYFDNGTMVGSIVNKECKIDSIAQSWAVLSGAADTKRAAQAMQSVEDHLVLREDGIITLLFPPFDSGETEPGYIKGYMPGVRENGGQYTHAAAWVMIAYTKLGLGNKAWEMFSMLNPIHHTSNIKEYSKYKAEPYVVAADVYSQPPNVGRGGWTWYTGSASWLYRAGLEFILGFQKRANEIVIEPCIPEYWKEYSIDYQYYDTIYKISVLNPECVQKGVRLVIVDGFPIKDNRIPLFNDHKEHTVKVFMG
ncbi:MAG: glycosyl transferase, partial [Caldisericia bacterium]|nr:glycosyl transferase [Caldisericia bacterium]